MKFIIATIIAILGVQFCAAVEPFKMSCENYKETEINLNLYNDTYYYFSQSVNWWAADESCRSYNMQLVTITTEQENNDVTAYASRFDLKEYRFWIGATDEAHSGIFTWRTTGKPVTFTKWARKEPSNTYHFNKGYENCVEIGYYSDQGNAYFWNDNLCDSVHHYMCERITPTKPASLTCTFHNDVI